MNKFFVDVGESIFLVSRWIFWDIYLLNFHFGHYYNGYGIITFERTQFNTIEEHDQYIEIMIQNLCHKLKPGDEVWNLGDFGSLTKLYTTDWIKATGAKTYFLYGNHDRKSDLPQFEHYFDQVFLYPVYLSQKLVVSHYPVGVFPDTINIHGHLHGAELSPLNYINASIHVINYQPISEKNLDSKFAQLPKFSRRFMYEPFASWYKFTQPKEDIIMTPDGIIDLSASRLFQEINTDRILLERLGYKKGDFND